MSYNRKPIPENILFFGHGAPVVWAFFEYEREYEVGWALNDFAETMLGHKPKTLHDWFVEHKEQTLG